MMKKKLTSKGQPQSSNGRKVFEVKSYSMFIHTHLQRNLVVKAQPADFGPDTSLVAFYCLEHEEIVGRRCLALEQEDRLCAVVAPRFQDALGQASLWHAINVLILYVAIVAAHSSWLEVDWWESLALSVRNTFKCARVHSPAALTWKVVKNR